MALSKPGTEAHVYAMVLRCLMLTAMGDREALQKAKSEFNRARPASIIVFEPLLSDPEHPSLRARSIMRLMTKTQARAALLHCWYTHARLYQGRTHKFNAIHTPLALVSNRFGAEAIPQEVSGQLAL